MYLIINLGLKSIRAIIFNESNRVIYSSSRPVNTWLVGDYVEQSAVEWRDLLFDLLDEIKVKTALSKSLSQIKYITCTTSSSCIFGMDSSGTPVTSVLMVSDKRATGESTYLKTILKDSEQIASGKMSIAPSSAIPKALWFKNNHPEVYSKVDYWMGAGEYLSYLLTGDVFTDHLNASKALYSDADSKYIFDAVDGLDIEASTFPTVAGIGQVYSLSTNITSNYSFPSDCKFILTTYDAICAVIGSGTGEDGNACDVSGTVTSVRLLCGIDNIIKGECNQGLNINSLKVIDKQVIGCSNNMGGGIIEWYKQAFFEDEPNQTVYSTMESEAIESGVGASGVLFLPYLLGERSPFQNRHIRAAFLGVNRDNTRADFSRAVLESTAFVTNDLTNKLKSSVKNVSSLSVSGGLARFDIANKIKSDVTNLPVHVLDNFESTSLGALVLMRMSLSHYGSYKEAVSDTIEIRQTIYPNKHNVSLYEEIFGLFLEARKNIQEFSERQWQLKERLSRNTKKVLKNL